MKNSAIQKLSLNIIIIIIIIIINIIIIMCLSGAYEENLTQQAEEKMSRRKKTQLHADRPAGDHLHLRRVPRRVPPRWPCG